MEKEEQLISLVSKKPFLFDKKHKYYKDTDRKQNAFAEIAEAVNLQGAKEAKEMWEKLRKEYTNYLRKLKSPSGSGASNGPFFRHAGSMSFYQSFYKPYKSVSNISENLGANGDDDEHIANTDNDGRVNVVFEGFQNNGEPEVVFHNQTEETPTSHNSRGKRRHRDDDFNERFFQALDKVSEKPGVEYDHFGANIAARIRKLASTNRRAAVEAQSDIFNSLFQYELREIESDTEANSD